MASALASAPSSDVPVEAPVSTPIWNSRPACVLGGGPLGDGHGNGLGRAGRCEAAEADGLAVLDQRGSLLGRQQGKGKNHMGFSV